MLEEQSFVGRQPIFDRQNHVYGYELLFRSGFNPNCAVFESGAEATATVIHNSLMGMGLDLLVGDSHAFINFPEEFFLNIEQPCFSPQRIVIEVLEDIPPSPEVIDSLKNLKDKGYVIALDDFVFKKRFIPFIQLADIIKFDIEHVKQENIPALFAKVRNISSVQILAEKVETKEMYQTCLDAGADFFQGFYFAKPEVVAGSKLSVGRHHLMLLLAKIMDERVNLDDLQVIIESDVGLSHKIMKMAQHYRTIGIPEFTNMKEVMMLFGVKRVQSWATLLSLCSLDDIDPEVFNLARIRAIFMRKLAEAQELLNHDSYYLAGLFSLLDTLLHEKLAEALGELPIDEEIKQGLLMGSGSYGQLIKITRKYESKSYQQQADLVYGKLYLQAVEEANKVADLTNP